MLHTSSLCDSSPRFLFVLSFQNFNPCVDRFIEAAKIKENLSDRL
jgi:hypothetical protein